MPIFMQDTLHLHWLEPRFTQFRTRKPYFHPEIAGHEAAALHEPWVNAELGPLGQLDDQRAYVRL